MYAVFFIWISLINSCLQNANIFVLSVSNIWVGQKGQEHKILNFYINSDSIFSLWILYEISCLLWSTRIYLVLMVSEIKGGPTPKIITFVFISKTDFRGVYFIESLRRNSILEGTSQICCSFYVSKTQEDQKSYFNSLKINKGPCV